MLNKLSINNFKSIKSQTINLGLVNVFIGENGSGKTNLLEAVAMLSCAKENKLLSEDFYAKGIRVAKSDLIFSSFLNDKIKTTIEIELHTSDNLVIPTNLKWISNSWHDSTLFDSKTIKTEAEIINDLAKLRILENNENYQHLKNYIIYSINTMSLRGLHIESRKEPLGLYGEGLDMELSKLTNQQLNQLKQLNYLIPWLNDFMIDADDKLKYKGFKPNKSGSKLYFTDKFMNENNNFFSSENANEGVLHLLFYITLFVSERTPKFFAIDNIESSLNPHLCTKLMEIICELAKKYNKQVLITTHNPAILDGLNLFDNDIRLFEVARNDEGHTCTRRIEMKPEIKDLPIGKRELKLSDMWTRGFLGAISQDF